MITQDYRLYFFFVLSFSWTDRDWFTCMRDTRRRLLPRLHASARTGCAGLQRLGSIFKWVVNHNSGLFFANAWRARYHPGDNNWAFVKKTNSFFTDLLQDSGGGEGACRCRKDQTHWCGWSHCHRERRSVRSRGHETQSRRLQAIWRSSYTFSRFRGPTKGEIPYI